MSFSHNIQHSVITALGSLYSESFTEKDFQINQTKPEFEGDYTIVLFSLVKRLKKSPEVIGNELGSYLIETNPEMFSGFNIIKGFLNLSLSEQYLHKFLAKNYDDSSYGKKEANGSRVMVEYSSPNTNKPIHLGHLRNNFLGWSVAEILKANGNEIIKSAILNDRGIHICKSMIAWQMFANGATPESTHTKGDHLVGDYYVKFNDEYKKQVEKLVTEGKTKELAEKEAPIMKAAQQMLQDWEKGKPEVIELWNLMNGWVYKGFEETYRRIGSDFDKTYYESQTYLLGKDFVKEGLEKGILYKKEDNSVWIDLSAEGLDEKLVLRGDGTSVYITQDIGLAEQKYKEYKPDKSIYVIGDEQNYHMKVLQLICKKLGMPFADNIYHLSYGMVELPSGKMKGREGTVVDADDIVDEMIATAREHTTALGKVTGFTEDELTKLYEILGLGAMKFYLVRVEPKKKMIFNPEESIDFHGFTGPFIQYTHARIKSILRKVSPFTIGNSMTAENSQLALLERELILKLELYYNAIEDAAKELNPSVIANYLFNLAQTFNTFYNVHSIANAESDEKKHLRLMIAIMTAHILQSGMALLGIRVPERM
jgi:arginyl-tRNA synthetase